MGDRSEFTRRRMLLTSSALASVGMAGCLGDDDDGGDDQEPAEEQQSGGGGYGNSGQSDSDREETNARTADQNVTEISVVSNAFEPRLEHVSVGETVRFVFEQGTHTATLYHPGNGGKPQRAPSDAQAWDSGQLGPGETYEVTLDEAGVYDYFCSPHEGRGMVGTLIVGDNDDPDQAGLSTPDQNSHPSSAVTALRELNEAARLILGIEEGTGGNAAHEVSALDQEFRPQLLQVSPGDAVRFSCVEGSHTTTLYHSDNGGPNRAPDDAESWDSGTLEEGDTFEISPSEPGVYDYFCRPHEGNGMVGTLIVGDNDDPVQDGLSEPADVPSEAESKLRELNDATRSILDVEEGVVSVVSNAFRPALTEIEPGDSVEFTVENGVHSVTLYHPDNSEDGSRQLRAPEGVEAWDSGNIEGGGTYTATFDQAGVYDYFCRPHEDQGMVGTVVVGNNDDPNQAGLSEPRNVPDAADARLRQLNDQARQRLGNAGDDNNGNGSVVDVEMFANQFQPEVRELQPGDTVRFTCQNGTHSTTLYHPDNGRERRAPVGSDSWDSRLMNPGDTFEVTLETEGVYDYYCSLHEYQGMVSTLIVGNNDNPDQAGLSVPSDARGNATEKLVDLNQRARERLRNDDGNDQRLEISLKSSFFTPDIDTLEAGGTVQFTCDEGTHTATLYHPDRKSVV